MMSSARTLRGAVFTVIMILAFAAPAMAQGAANPFVTGPIPAVSPGDPSRNYPWFATNLDIGASGFVEEEFVALGGRAAVDGRVSPRDPRRALTGPARCVSKGVASR